MIMRYEKQEQRQVKLKVNVLDHFTWQSAPRTSVRNYVQQTFPEAAIAGILSLVVVKDKGKKKKIINTILNHHVCQEIMKFSISYIYV